MVLQFSNTLSRRREPFEPLVPGKVSIYCCGVTVYDLCHLGHARSYIVWDVLRRYLIWRGYEVTFVQNFTDIDDKILQRAAAEGTSMEEVSERNIAAYFADMDALNILRADRMPRATRCLEGIRDLIGRLEARGAAYSTDGDVYFAVMRRPDYGKLSHRDLGEQQEGASGRLDAEGEARKRHPFDFALWKGAGPDEPGFPSPWGPGRPGWHIECSAMVRQELGETIDIHLGGADLIFPHHENEIAQSEAASGKPLARYWLHNGMVNVGGEKMSKSLGNFTTIRALLASGVSAMTLRLFVLQAHYRKPLDFSEEALRAAATGWKGLETALGLGLRHGDDLGWPRAPVPLAGTTTAVDRAVDVAVAADADARERFVAAMDDDLNTSGALAVLFDLARPLRSLANRLDRGEPPADCVTPPQAEALGRQWRLLVELAGVLGLRPPDPRDEGPAGRGTAAADAAIEAAVAARSAAKRARDYAEADRIREELRAQGIELVDRPGGVTDWLRR